MDKSQIDEVALQIRKDRSLKIHPHFDPTAIKLRQVTEALKKLNKKLTN